MDPYSLVDEQLEAGKKFLTALHREGVPVDIAFWHRPEEDARWSFCVATPLVEQEGPLGAARKVVPVRRSMGDEFVIDPTDVTLLKSSHPLVKALLSAYPRPPKKAGWEENPPLVNGWDLASDFPQWYQVYRNPDAIPAAR
ncbi:MAG: hypothetical protein MUF18_17335 [Fimbriiglobus sp.]|jgi:hypothetical protein|nr:hypothetical protein [Fimbriiglobus sp.]